MYESTSTERREGLVELTMRSNLLSDRDWRVTNFLNNKPLIIFYQYTSNTYNLSVKFMSDMFISVLVGYGVAVDRPVVLVPVSFVHVLYTAIYSGRDIIHQN